MMVVRCITIISDDSVGATIKDETMHCSHTVEIQRELKQENNNAIQILLKRTDLRNNAH
jgi:hypothetical protein